jgi:Flp pilus assembly protein TadG
MGAWARHQGGQATVELVAVVPLIVLAGAACVQVGLAAHAWGAARDAARAGARAALVEAPTRAAARRVLGESLARGAVVRTLTGRDGTERVDVRVAVPMILPWIPGATVGAHAEVEP